jgi:hypothetical protein
LNAGAATEPDEVIVSDTGVEMGVSGMGDPDADYSNANIGDGSEYVSAMQVCTIDENSIGIVGIQITMTSV